MIALDSRANEVGLLRCATREKRMQTRGRTPKFDEALRGTCHADAFRAAMQAISK
jgi:hypothetical protein